MKRLFTLIVLVAFTVGMVGCSQQAGEEAPPAADTNAAPPAAEAPAANQ